MTGTVRELVTDWRLHATVLALVVISELIY